MPKKTQVIRTELNDTEKKILAHVLVDENVPDVVLAKRIGITPQRYCIYKNNEPLKSYIEQALQEPIDQIKAMKPLALNRLKEMVKSKNMDDVKFAINKVLAAEVNLMKVQAEVNVNHRDMTLAELIQKLG